MFSVLAKAMSAAVSPTEMATFSNLFSVAVPALPGAQILFQLVMIVLLSMRVRVRVRHYLLLKHSFNLTLLYLLENMLKNLRYYKVSYSASLKII